ncbi:hypothetical protein ACUXNS_001497 [Brevibacterium pityocampae]
MSSIIEANGWTETSCGVNCPSVKSVKMLKEV